MKTSQSISSGRKSIVGERGQYDRAVLNAAFAVFILGLLYVGFWHEAWADEAQAWLIARDDTPWRILSQTARYEGTPPLWHLLLWPLAHLGFPYRGLWLISASLAVCGAYIVLYRSAFPALMRVGVVFSYYFAYQYAVVARSYAIDLLLFPAIALCYGERLEKPVLYCVVLGLIATCNTHGFLLSGVLFLDFMWASWKGRLLRVPRVVVAGVLYILIASAALAVTWPPTDISFKTNRLGELPFVHAALLIAEPFVERLDIFGLEEPVVGSQIIGVILSIVLVWPTAYLFHRSNKLWLFLAMIGVFFAFTAVKYGQPWHAGLLFLAWIVCLWTSWSEVDKLTAQRRLWLKVSISIIFLVQCWYTVAAWTREVDETYAPGQTVASALGKYLKTYPGTKVAGMGFKAFTIQPWADHNLFDNFKNPTPNAAYFDWRTNQPYVAVLQLADWRRLVEAQNYGVVILSSLDTLKQPGDLSAYLQVAKTYGYCWTYFPAGMIWKTYIRENQSIFMFTRCAVGSRGANATSGR